MNIKTVIKDINDHQQELRRKGWSIVVAEQEWRELKQSIYAERESHELRREENGGKQR